MVQGLLTRARLFFTGRLWLWAGLCLLLAAGVLGSIADLAAVPVTETQRANQQQQRIIIDPTTGLVAGLSEQKPSAAFDVGEEHAEAKPAPTPPATATEAPPAAEQAQAPAAPAPSSVGEALRLPDARPTPPVIARGAQSLVRAPAPEITQKADGLLLPMRNEAGARPAKLYARAFSRPTGKALLALVITDTGFSEETLRTVLELPVEISVAFSPYATEPARKIEALRNRGHEVWAMLPAMGAHFPQIDPGPLGLIASISEPEALRRLHATLAATLGSVGVILPADETFSQQKKLWPPVIEDILARGLDVLSTHPSRATDGWAGTAEERDAIRRDALVLDANSSVATLASKLAGLRELAMKQKKTTVLLSAQPLALRTLAEWLAQKPLGDDVVLAPLSALYASDAPPPPPAKEEEGGGHGGAEEAHGEEKSSGGH
jgi:polysaccharide deacetylase 2 family uncharacterized protein YibQ